MFKDIFFCVPGGLLFQHEEKSRCSTELLKPENVLVIFCASQQFSYIFEAAAQFCGFVRSFTPASNAAAKVSKNGFGWLVTQWPPENL